MVEACQVRRRLNTQIPFPSTRRRRKQQTPGQQQRSERMGRMRLIGLSFTCGTAQLAEPVDIHNSLDERLSSGQKLKLRSNL